MLKLFTRLCFHYGRDLAVIQWMEPGEEHFNFVVPRIWWKKDRWRSRERNIIRSGCCCSIRNIRGEMNCRLQNLLTFFWNDKVTAEQAKYIKSLVRIDELHVDSQMPKPKASASAVVKGCDYFYSLEGLIDLDVERSRIQKEISRLYLLSSQIKKKSSQWKFCFQSTGWSYWKRAH